jgi:ribosomal protein L12E/L44/L45/RPP1/RPP2
MKNTLKNNRNHTLKHFQKKKKEEKEKEKEKEEEGVAGLFSNV